MMYKEGGQVTNWPFITRFATHQGNIWASTLNDGIYKKGNDGFNIIPGSDRFKYIRDIAFSGDDADPYILTNHYVYTPDWRDSIKADGFYRLVITDDRHVYGVGNFGIREFIFSSEGNSQKDYYTDIKFNPEAVVSHGNTIFAGSACGVFVFDQPLASGSPHKNIQFEPAAIERFWEYTLYIIGALALLVVAILITIRLEKGATASKDSTVKKERFSKGFITLKACHRSLAKSLLKKSTTTSQGSRISP